MIGRALGLAAALIGIWHYDGQNWTPFTAFTGVSLSRISPYAITGTANGEVWISGIDHSVSVGDGEDGNDPTVLLHYDGTTLEQS